QHKYTVSKPSAQDNLTQLYGLSDLAASVARFDVATGQKQKLRKSYKNQISDLPGKHNIPTAGASLLPIIYAPPRGNGLVSLKDMDMAMLNRSLALDPAKPEGIRGFNPSDLALS
ncbi:Rox3-domain-containing protein, partial [Nadsonia fulvescens var. elongata DSM 6958]